MLEIIPLVLGPASTNCYLIADPNSGEAAVIDPAWDGRVITTEAQKRGWKIDQLWYTHAHFDHFAGAAELVEALQRPDLPVALHSADLELLKNHGLRKGLGFEFALGPLPSVDLAAIRVLSVGDYRFQVRHTPGHSPGHCMFYCAQENVLFSGDLIFQGGIGRTDLPGGDLDELVESIQKQVFTLPDETRILSGHGPETWVGVEKCGNPFVGT